MSEIILSNSLADLAERVRAVNAEGRKAAETVIERALEAGRLLIEAKQQCRHGEWLPFLKRAEIPERSAQAYMKLVRAGLDIRKVADLGGIKAALDYLAEPRPPKADECLMLRGLGYFGIVFEASEAPGFYHYLIVQSDAATLEDDGGGIIHQSKRPVCCERVKIDDKTVNVLWYLVDITCGAPPTHRDYVPRETAAGLIGHAEETAERIVQAEIAQWRRQ